MLLFNLVHQFLSGTCQFLFVGFGVFIFIAEYVGGSSTARSFTVAMIAYASAWVLQVVANAAFLWSKNNKSFLTKHTLSITEEGVFDRTPFNRSIFYWPGVVKVVRRPGFVALYLTSYMAHIVPMRAFSTYSESEVFVRRVRARIDAA